MVTCMLYLISEPEVMKGPKCGTKVEYHSICATEVPALKNFSVVNSNAIWGWPKHITCTSMEE